MRHCASGFWPSLTESIELPNGHTVEKIIASENMVPSERLGVVILINRGELDGRHYGHPILRLAVRKGRIAGDESRLSDRNLISISSNAEE